MQLAAIAGSDREGYFEVRSVKPDGPPGPRKFIPVTQPHVLLTTVGELQRANVYLGALPRVRRSGTAADVAHGWSVWADCDSPEAVTALRRFKPRPSLVVETSPGRMQAWWALRHPIPASWVRRANRRLAHALGADLQSTDVARVLRAIGSVNYKHDPAAAVKCVHCGLDTFTVEQVVGSLSDPVSKRPRRKCAVHGTQAAAMDGLVRVVNEAAVGQRNSRLFWAANRALEEGRDVELLRSAALDVGLLEGEVDATLASAIRTVSA